MARSAEHTGLYTDYNHGTNPQRSSASLVAYPHEKPIFAFAPPTASPSRSCRVEQAHKDHPALGTLLIISCLVVGGAGMALPLPEPLRSRRCRIWVAGSSIACRTQEYQLINVHLLGAQRQSLPGTARQHPVAFSPPDYHRSHPATSMRPASFGCPVLWDPHLFDSMD